MSIACSWHASTGPRRLPVDSRCENCALSLLVSSGHHVSFLYDTRSRGSLPERERETRARCVVYCNEPRACVNAMRASLGVLYGLCAVYCHRECDDDALAVHWFGLDLCKSQTQKHIRTPLLMMWNLRVGSLFRSICGKNARNIFKSLSK